MLSRFAGVLRLLLCSALLLLSFTKSLGCTAYDDVDRDGNNLEGENHDSSVPAPNGCYAIQNEEGRWLTTKPDGDGFAFVDGDIDVATSFFMKASDLDTFLFYDPNGGYVVAGGEPFVRKTFLHYDAPSRQTREEPQTGEPLPLPVPPPLPETFDSGAEWKLEVVGERSEKRFHLRSKTTSDVAATLSFFPAKNCAEHPEMSLDAARIAVHVKHKSADDGWENCEIDFREYYSEDDVWGIAEPHTHIMSNHGFGGNGVFHGAPFHPLGVEHALGDCEANHGQGGALDVFGWAQEKELAIDKLFIDIFPRLITGDWNEFAHSTKGYPEFTDWPSAPFSKSHQTQYWVWIERAYLGGLRLMVQHAVSNSVICEMYQDLGIMEPLGHVCNDMVDVERSIEAMYAMERYIDAQAGGPGQGFFRIVTSPEEARQVIKDDKLAVVLGIETSNLFDCFLTPRPGMPVCDEAHINRMLDKYYDLGVRALFPVHKFDNQFSPGDGQKEFIQIGNILNSGHYSSFSQDCLNVPGGFDKGPVTFGGFNEPRGDYFSEPPLLNSPPIEREHLLWRLIFDWLPPLDFPFIDIEAGISWKWLDPALEGEWCQSGTLTHKGEYLVREMIKRGMIVEVDHFPRNAYQRAFDILEDHDYPAAGTHGRRGPDDKIYDLGGISVTSPGTCHDPNNPGSTLAGLKANIKKKIEHGAYPGEGWSWDLNGYASYRKARFGPKRDEACGPDQPDPISYPFHSYDGQVTFTEPWLGNRQVDFNTEGLVHIGLLPEYVEDLRRDAANAGCEKDLEPIFHSAEAYLKMWEKAEERAEYVRTTGDHCFNDPNKTEPGVCGCGNPDTDSDGDGTPDCRDFQDGPGDLFWSVAGPIGGLHCTKINEPSEPENYTWNDNFLCSRLGLGLEWSYNGPRGGKRCTHIKADRDPHAWGDNYLCVPPTSPYYFEWSQNGPIAGRQCLKIEEGSDPYFGKNNYLCWTVDFGFPDDACCGQSSDSCSMRLNFNTGHTTWGPTFGG